MAVQGTAWLEQIQQWAGARSPVVKSPGDTWQCPETVVIDGEARGRRRDWHLVGEAGDAGQHPTESDRSLPTPSPLPLSKGLSGRGSVCLKGIHSICRGALSVPPFPHPVLENPTSPRVVRLTSPCPHAPIPHPGGPLRTEGPPSPPCCSGVWPPGLSRGERT